MEIYLSNQVEAYKNKINRVVMKYQDRYKFITERYVEIFIDEMELLRDESLAAYNEGEDELSIILACELLCEMTRSLEYTEDSDGRVSDSIEALLVYMEEICEEIYMVAECDRTLCFITLMMTAKVEDFNQWTVYRLSVLHLCRLFIDSMAMREEYLAFIEKCTQAGQFEPRDIWSRQLDKLKMV